MFSLTVLEAEIKVLTESHVASEGPREESLPCLFQFLVTSGFAWLVAVSLQSLHLSSHGLLCVCLSVSSPLLM